MLLVTVLVVSFLLKVCDSWISPPNAHLLHNSQVKDDSWENMVPDLERGSSSESDDSRVSSGQSSVAGWESDDSRVSSSQSSVASSESDDSRASSRGFVFQPVSSRMGKYTPTRTKIGKQSRKEELKQLLTNNGKSATSSNKPIRRRLCSEELCCTEAQVFAGNRFNEASRGTLCAACLDTPTGVRAVYATEQNPQYNAQNHLEDECIFSAIVGDWRPLAVRELFDGVSYHDGLEYEIRQAWAVRTNYHHAEWKIVRYAQLNNYDIACMSCTRAMCRMCSAAFDPDVDVDDPAGFPNGLPEVIQNLLASHAPPVQLGTPQAQHGWREIPVRVIKPKLNLFAKTTRGKLIIRKKPPFRP